MDVISAYRDVGTAGRFSDCTSYGFELLEAEVRGDTAYTVGFEHICASVDGVPRTYTLRATQIHRREDGTWQVAHRHGSAPPVAFEGCVWDESQVRTCEFIDCTFTSCSMSLTDFTDARLSGAVMRECDLKSARFVNADMRGLDLSGSYDYLFDLRDNQVAGLRVDPLQGVNLLRAFGVELVD